MSVIACRSALIELFGVDIRKSAKGTKMVCLREYRYEILLKNTTLKECEDFIKKHSEDVYLVPGGYKVKGIILLGATAPVGFSGNDIIFQFTKPCFGFFIIRLKNEAEEVKKLKTQYQKDKKIRKIQ